VRGPESAEPAGHWCVDAHISLVTRNPSAAATMMSCRSRILRCMQIRFHKQPFVNSISVGISLTMTCPRLPRILRACKIYRRTARLCACSPCWASGETLGDPREAPYSRAQLFGGHVVFHLNVVRPDVVHPQVLTG